MTGIQEIFRGGEGVFWLEHGPARPAFVSEGLVVVFSTQLAGLEDSSVENLVSFLTSCRRGAGDR